MARIDCNQHASNRRSFAAPARRAASWLAIGMSFGLLAGCGGDTTTRPSISAPGRESVAGAGSTAFGAGAPGEVVVTLRQGTNAAAVWAEYALIPQEVLTNGRTWRTVAQGSNRSIEEIILQLANDQRINDVEANVPVGTPTLRQSSMSFDEGFPSLGMYHDQSLGRRLHLDAAHQTSRGYGAIVAILDTGIDLDHPGLKARVLPGWDFVDRDNDASESADGMDQDGDGHIDEALGHGSHVAGLVMLVAPGARILPLRVLNNDGIGTAYSVASAIEYAVNNGARVINMSLTFSAPSAAVDRAIALATSRGVVLVAAAGNTGMYGPLDYPASDSRVLAVASVNALQQRSSFSAWSTGVALAAPGENLLSTYWNGGYAVWSGTSMAAPIVSGTAALLMSNRLRLPAAEVRHRLLTTAALVQGTSYGLGAGIVDPRAAVGTLTLFDAPQFQRVTTSPDGR